MEPYIIRIQNGDSKGGNIRKQQRSKRPEEGWK
jgi:hypothetical protein